MSKEVGIKDGESVKDYKKRKKQESKTEKENTMKSKVKTVAKYVATILVTLAVVYGGYSLYMQGYNHGANDQKQINAEVKKQVAQLKPLEK